MSGRFVISRTKPCCGSLAVENGIKFTGAMYKRNEKSWKKGKSNARNTTKNHTIIFNILQSVCDERFTAMGGFIG